MGRQREDRAHADGAHADGAHADRARADGAHADGAREDGAHADGARADKVCRVCGRRMQWRARWADSWDEVRYCSSGCRRRGLRPVDERLEDAVLDLLARRPRGATICPSEAARLVAGARPGGDDAAWRELMEPARMAARRLVARGEVEVTQRGRVVDPSTARGPLRVRLAR